MSVSLTETEEKICTLLDQVARNLQHQSITTVTLRFVGGWVRDKLLGLECDDLDVAVDSMTGYDFALAVENYLNSQHNDIDVGESHRICKIAANPLKSKHLETAHTRIHGMSIDFVNLRSEEYAADSRIPTMKFGTPLEDALRRDITINALFFNIHTRQVEDPTNMGLTDLKDGIVRTPLEPSQTFMDDPLRILRVIRFASRFNYSVHQDIVPCVQAQAIQNALRSKVSKERVGIEVDKMLKGPNPVLSMELIQGFGIYDVIFAPPTSASKKSVVDASQAVNAARVLQWGLNECQHLLPPTITPVSSAHKRILHLFAALSPFHGLTFQDKAFVSPSPKYIVLHSLKFSSADSDMIIALTSRSRDFHDLASNNKLRPLDRKSLGLGIRGLALRPLLGQWPLLALTSLVMQMARHQYELDASASSRKQLIEDYGNLMRRIQDLHLSDVHAIKPILDGRQLSTLLNVRPGPAIAAVLASVLEWQLEHEHGTPDACMAWLRDKHGVGGPDGASHAPQTKKAQRADICSIQTPRSTYPHPASSAQARDDDTHRPRSPPTQTRSPTSMSATLTTQPPAPWSLRSTPRRRPTMPSPGPSTTSLSRTQTWSSSSTSAPSRQSRAHMVRPRPRNPAVNLTPPTSLAIVLTSCTSAAYPGAAYMDFTGITATVVQVQTDYLTQMEDHNRAASHALLQTYGVRLKKNNIACKAIAMRGDPRDEIARKVSELNADVLVIGSRGLGPVKRTFLGSVSDYLVHHVHCAVLVVRDHEDHGKFSVKVTSPIPAARVQTAPASVPSAK
ncbi:hypothetical protein SeMB42_g00895 [Synchytrium endobioticum]|uniref:Poly A polymerase head domain-containing protein n=1 Tax=Synchytrium endobioticum TaxID=286115 RepID=A0A507DPQ2_9FUNG|nr:hypothetical protein SeMB42_g00895 [Synchytrium endobioticum]